MSMVFCRPNWTWIKKGLSRLVFCLAFLAFHPALADEATRPIPLSASGKLASFALEPHQVTELLLTLNLLEGYKAYSDQFKVEILSPEGFRVSKLQLSPEQVFFDKFSKKKRTGVSGQAELKVVIEAPAQLADVPKELEVQLTYQACTSVFCLFPDRLNFKVPFQPKSRGAPGESPSTNSSLFHLDMQKVAQQGLFLTFIAVFFAGVLTSFTPCIFPMIPITLSVLGRNAHSRSRGQNFLVSNLYVLGIAVTYAIMGVVAASTGALFGSFMSHPAVLSAMCLVFLAMALSMFGFYEFEAPAFVRNRFSNSSDLTGYSGAFFSGIISGVVASPCVGPVLVVILTYIAKTQNLWLGFWLMFVYALGMGQIFLVLGAFSQMTKLLPKSGPWLDGVKHFFGLLMVGVFYYYLDLLLPIRFWDVAFGIGLALLSGYFGAFSTSNSIWKWTRKGLLQALVILGGAYIVMGVFDLRNSVTPRMIKDGSTNTSQNWQKYSESLLRKAATDGRPVIIDFAADWCAACKELEQFTFSDPRVQGLLNQFLLLRYDATTSTPELDVLKEKYNIVGLPTVVFLDGKGNILKDLTLTAFENPEPFIERLKKANGK